jgi:acetyl-CoA carboxylase biotin carboxyl carrier protein
MIDNTEALAQVRHEAERVIAAVGQQVSRMVLRAGPYALEVEWQDAAGGAAAPAAGPLAADRPGPADGPPPGQTEVTAPLVGVFYRSPAPGEPPFVGVGDVVAKGQQLAVIEAMKLMNAITAPAAGTVVAVLAEDRELVEYGQPLVCLAGPGEG